MPTIDYKEILMRLIAGSKHWEHTGDVDEDLMRVCTLMGISVDDEDCEDRFGRAFEKSVGEQKSLYEPL